MIRLIELYTLPTCGICHMIKTKLQNKSIEYQEKDFSILAEKLNIDRAPVMVLSNGNKIFSPSEMIEWINGN